MNNLQITKFSGAEALDKKVSASGYIVGVRLAAVGTVSGALTIKIVDAALNEILLVSQPMTNVSAFSWMPDRPIPVDVGCSVRVEWPNAGLANYTCEIIVD